MRIPVLFTSIILCSLLSVTGCNTRIGVFGGELSSGTDFAGREVCEPCSQQRVKLTQIISTTEGNGILRVQAGLRSNSTSLQMLEYKFHWFDINNFEIDSESQPWIPITLYPEDFETLQATAPSSAAVKFRLYIQDVD